MDESNFSGSMSQGFPGIGVLSRKKRKTSDFSQLTKRDNESVLYGSLIRYIFYPIYFFPTIRTSRQLEFRDNSQLSYGSPQFRFIQLIRAKSMQIHLSIHLDVTSNFLTRRSRYLEIFFLDSSIRTLQLQK